MQGFQSERGDILTPSTDLRDRQLLRFCETLAAVEPRQPTLCAGWTAHDLAIHLWLIKHDPLSWPGVVVGSLRGLTQRRADLIKRRWPYAALVDRLRHDGGRIACMPFDALEGHRHAIGEYYVHTQDVARPAGLTQPRPDEPLQEALWLRAGAAARAMRRRLPPGLVLVHVDGRVYEVSSDDPPVHVRGLPSELICWVYGRRDVADVTVED